VGKGGNNSPVIANLVLAAASFILGGDVLLLRKNYYDLMQAGQSIFEKCAALRIKDNLSLFETMQVVEDYHLTLIQSPPIPFKMYLKYKDDIKQAFQSS